MKNIFTLSMLVILLISQINYSQEEKEVKNSPSISVESSFANKYVWRGISYDEGFVIQPALNIEYKDFLFQVWGNYVVKEEDGFPKNHELDFMLLYNIELCNLTLKPFLQYYTYPDQEEDSALELSLTAEYTLNDFTIGTTLSRDIKLGRPYLFGYHSLGYSKEVYNKLALNASAGFGWGTKNFNTYYIGLEKGGIDYIFTDLSFDYYINEQINLHPFIESYFIPNSDIKNLTNGTVVNFGVNLSYQF